MRVNVSDIAAAHVEFGPPDSPSGAHSPVVRKGQHCNGALRPTGFAERLASHEHLDAAREKARASATIRTRRAIKQREAAEAEKAKRARIGLRGRIMMQLLPKTPPDAAAAAAAATAAAAALLVLGVVMGYALGKHAPAAGLKR
eukprot:scaffold153348_cov28-Tisochrysis_lutea.AAC.2